MSDCCSVQRFEQQPLISGDQVSREANSFNARAYSTPAPIDAAFVGQNGDCQIVNAGSYQPYDRNSSYYANNNQPYGGWNSGYNHRPSLPHTIIDGITQQHSRYNQPYGSWNSGYNHRPSLPHTIIDGITQQHSRYNQPYGSWNSGYNHRPSLPHMIGGHGFRRHR